MNSKDCSICVYHSVCMDRRHDEAITDCCVPEAPLRKLQAHTSNVTEFAAVTNQYISDVKNKSIYWIKNKST